MVVMDWRSNEVPESIAPLHFIQMKWSYVTKVEIVNVIVISIFEIVC